MKILVISNLYPPRFLGGYELGCAQMVESLRRAGHQVRVVTSGGEQAAGLGEAGQFTRSLELMPVNDLERMRFAGPELRQHFHARGSAVNVANVDALIVALADFEPDVAYLWNLLGIGALGILALLRDRGIEWVWHLMDSVPRQMCGFAVSGPHLARELNSIFPGRYVACSSQVLAEIRVGEVDLGNEVYLVPNWLVGEPPAPRTEFFRGGHLRVMSASGVLCEPKGTDILIESAARLRDMGFANFTIDLFGGIEDGRFRSLVQTHDVSNVVRLMGPRPHAEFLPMYQAYDLFAFPTWDREPSAFAPLEATGAGCVALISAGCGNAEWMIGGVDCLKAPRDARSFASRIAEVLRGDIDLAAIGARGQAVAWRDFHIADATKKVELLLAEAASERRSERGVVGSSRDFARFAEGVIDALIAER